MATELRKPVVRVMNDWGGHGVDAKRPLVVTLNPAGFISFRLKGTWQAFDLSFGKGYLIAVRDFATKKAEAKRKAKAAKKFSGI